MKAADRLLLAALALALLLMLLAVVSPRAPAGSAAGPALSGEPRDVDLDLLRRRILRGELTDREALYWHAEE